MTKLRLSMVSSDADHALAILGSMTIAVWRRNVEMQIVAPHLEVQNKLAKEYGRVGVLNVFEPSCRPVPSNVTALLKDGPASLGGAANAATVMEGAGVVGMAIRSLMMALSLLQPRDARTAVFATAQEAAAWMPEILPERDRPTAKQIQEAIEALRKAIPDAAPRPPMA